MNKLNESNISKAALKKRNLRKRNFGIKTRTASSAVSILLKATVKGESNRAKLYSAFLMFFNFINESENINDLRRFTREHVESFAVMLLQKISNNELKSATAHNYLSALNTVFKLARKDEKLRVRPVADAHFPKRSYVRTENRARCEIKDCWPQSIVVICMLAKCLGLRFEEAAKLNARAALKQALAFGGVDVIYGTKGGRPRIVTITNDEQLNALKMATQYQQKDHFSLIPSYLNYTEYKQKMYRIAGALGICFHDFRHHFAQTKMREHFDFPVRIETSISSRKEYFKFVANERNCSVLDVKNGYKKAALETAEELGHSRDNIIVNYGC